MHMTKHIVFQSTLHFIEYMNTGAWHMHAKKFFLCPVSVLFLSGSYDRKMTNVFELFQLELLVSRLGM